jgi:hypothetical protein
MNIVINSKINLMNRLKMDSYKYFKIREIKIQINFGKILKYSPSTFKISH